MSNIENAINEMRNMRESYDVLATELVDSKQAIVDAISQMGGSATTSMTWTQLAQQIEDLQTIAPNIEFNGTITTPIDVVAIMTQRGVGIKRINDSISTKIPNYCFMGNSSIEYVKMSNVSSVGATAFNDMSTISHIELPNVISCGEGTFSFIGNTRCKILLPRLKSINSSQLFRGSKVSTLDLSTLRESGSSFQLLECSCLIDLITGAGFVSSISFESVVYNPTEAYRTNTSSLCFDTDFEEYGQIFANNFEKWKWCVINHFASNLQDRTGQTAYTITFGSGVLSHFDVEMIAAFTDKNWNLA